MRLIIIFTSLITLVIAQQPQRNYNDYHNQRFNDNKETSSSEKGFEPKDSGQQIITSRGSRTFNFEDYEDYESPEGSLVDTIPGKAGKDFPAYTSIPKTSFTCKGKNTGYFADPETNCQVFHVCIQGGQKISFLCPNGSIFNQKVSVCDWWYDVDCISSSEQIDSNDIQRNPAYNDPRNDYQYQHFIVESEPYYDLSLASSGGNQNPRYENQASRKSKNEQSGENNSKQDVTKKTVIKNRIAKSSTSSTIRNDVKEES